MDLATWSLVPSPWKVTQGGGYTVERLDIELKADVLAEGHIERQLHARHQPLTIDPQESADVHAANRGQAQLRVGLDLEGRRRDEERGAPRLGLGHGAKELVGA